MCITYAVQHPENVSNLIVYGGFHNGRTAFFHELVDAFIGLIRADWGGYGTGTMLDVFAPSAPPEARDFFIEYQRQAANAENAAATWLACFDFHVTALLPQVRAPTLVLHRRGDRAVPFEQGREIAAAIPGARFVALEDDNHHILSDPDPVAEAIERFLYGTEGQPARKPGESMTAILFADIADSTALTERLGDTAFRAKARDLDTALRSVIRDHTGTPIEGKLLGDGVLAVFTSARQAIEAALACARAGDDAGLPLHLGLHAGDVIRESDPDGRSNVYGGAVNIASRISGLSAPGEVLVSETVRSLARTSAGVRFEDRGDRELKGVSEAVRVWAVRET
jgi:class 3 adenylate cyclase